MRPTPTQSNTHPHCETQGSALLKKPQSFHHFTFN
uniref:Uncharacterized protein n=1 Tax=Anguilla anguilla TaxID=7936 RepID=A0A0E9U5I4_ANGAN